MVAERGRQGLSYPVGVAVSISITGFRRCARFAQAALIGIVLTGSWVRLTGSGLGCSDWPECNEERFVDVSSWHAAIEQVNRLLTGLVAFAVILAVVASFLVRGLSPKVRWLAASLVVGVVAQVVIGAYVVWTGLNPWSNMVHFLVSAVLVTLATLLVASTDLAPRSGVRNRHVRQLGAVFCLVTAVAVITGTVVTGSGPHAGDADAIRLGFEIRNVVRLHSAAVWVAIFVLLGCALLARRHGETVVYGPLSTVIGVFIAQGFIGYVQYFAGIPAALVALHIAGSVAATIATTNLATQVLGKGSSAVSQG